MIIKRKLYSRHTPKGLIKYKEYRDEDLDKMTKGQKLRALEKEDKDAQANMTKYGVKKLLKWGPAGAITAAVPAAVIAGKGHRLSGAAVGGLTGAILGSTIGYARGEHFARKEGHDRDKRSLRLARKMDENARKNHLDDDFEYRVKDNIRARQAAEDARMAREYAAYNFYNSL